MIPRSRSFPYLAIAAVFVFAGLCKVDAADEKLLIDFAKPAELARVSASGASDDEPKPVTTDVVGGPHGKALAVKLVTKGLGSPGIVIKPETEGGVMDASTFTRVEVEVTNTGTVPLTVVVRVDNEDDWQRSPWSSNGATIQPGESGTVTVPFGTNWGSKIEYKFDPAKLSQILVFMASPEPGGAFRLDALRAAGRSANSGRSTVTPEL